MRGFCFVGALLIAAACTTDVITSVPSGEGGAPAVGGSGGMPITTATGGTTTVTVGPSTGGSGGGCTDLTIEPIFREVPADIIFLVDNSVSMGSPTSKLQNVINLDFGDLLFAANLDFQLIMLTEHGIGSSDVCIGPPLSATTNCAGPPTNVPGQFYHYSLFVNGHDSLCRMLSSMDGTAPDAFGQIVGGWEPLLRSEAEKFIIAMTSDGVACTFGNTTYDDADQVSAGQQAAIDADLELLSLTSQFGTTSARHYRAYGILGLPVNGMDPYYDAFDPVVTGLCPGGGGPGTLYQWLTKGTGGLRFDVCNTFTLGSHLQTIAADIIDNSASDCRFTLPPPPMGQPYDYNLIDIIYTPNGNGAPQTFVKVDSPGLCMPGAFYIDNSFEFVLCPEACQVVLADPQAKLEIRVRCHGFP